MKDWHRRGAAGQPPTAEIIGNRPAQPVSANSGHSRLSETPHPALTEPPTFHVLPDKNYRASMAEHTGAVLTEDRIRAIAGRSAGEDNLFDEGIERSGQTRNVSFRIGGK